MLRRRIPRWSAALTLLAAALLMAASAQARELPDFTDLAKEAGPAVVNISTVRMVKPSNMQFRFHGPQGPQGPGGERGMPGQQSPLEEFFEQFERFFGPQMPQRPRKTRSLGSGFIMSKDGYVVTNNHVVAQAETIEVILRGEEDPVSAEIVGRDPETDLALIKIDVDRDLPVLEFGSSEEADVGEWVVAIGNPFGLDHSVTSGIVSAKGRIIGAGAFDDFIQTDASINPGNSGGPLLNMDGEVIGINTAIVATGQGIGFAVSSDLARDVIQQLRDKGKVARGWLGVTIQPVDEKLAKALGLDEARGALIASVSQGDPAAEAGLQAGDVITAVDGEPIEDSQELVRTIASMKPGQDVSLKVWRKGESMTRQVTLGERDLQRQAEAEQQPSPQPDESRLGLAVKPVGEREARALGMEEARGLLVSGVAPGSPAQEAGLAPGDVILEVNQQTVDTVQAMQQIIRTAAEEDGMLLLLVTRQGRTLFRTLELPQEDAGQ
jgi:serine protease Do